MTELLAVAFWLTAGVQDVRRRKISWKTFAAFGTGAILFQFFIKQEPWGSWIGGIALGGLLLGIGFVTREAIGYGDGLAVMVTGMLTASPNMTPMMTGRFLTFIRFPFRSLVPCSVDYSSLVALLEYFCDFRA